MKNKNKKEIIELKWEITDICNFNCAYCIKPSVNKKKKNNQRKNKHLILKRLKTILSTDQYLYNIQISGGEPTLIPHFTKICSEITKKHKLSLITNLSYDLQDFTKYVNPQNVNFIIASFHYNELIRQNKIPVFLKNVKELKKNGFNTFINCVAYPPILKDIENIKNILEPTKIQFDFVPFFGIYKNKTYPKAYTKGEIDKFQIKKIKQTSTNSELCNAGYNSFFIDELGDVKSCHLAIRKIGNIFNDFKLKQKMTICDVNLCACPVKTSNPSLFKEALNVSKKNWFWRWKLHDLRPTLILRNTYKKMINILKFNK